MVLAGDIRADTIINWRFDDNGSRLSA